MSFVRDECADHLPSQAYPGTVEALIICSQAIASPYLIERCKSAEMWLLGIAAFFAVSASMYSWPKEKQVVLRLVQVFFYSWFLMIRI